MINSPMLEVSSGTRLLLGQKAGSPMTQMAPSTAPVRPPSPPMTAMDTSASESGTVKNRSP